MNIQTVTSRAFNQDPTSVKRAARLSPVQITERGKVSHVLLSIEKYEELTNTKQNIVELLCMPNNDDVDFELPKLNVSSLKAEDFD
ncbi:MAG: type II toxin-antitoxin system prevent-host-death family antitoxin [Alteromonadaceae bacterium]|nr:type II toxin-antitoxin system prevent-host-death family antitoxin [Alteromonadaceae bacterium]